MADVTVVITTKNRKEDLANAIRSALAQDVPVEVLVIDDGSTDGTLEMVRREFPTVRLERSEQSLGLIVQRNLAAQLATTPFLISIDDDALFVSPATVRQTLADFDHPRIGAVAIPYIDVKYGPTVRQKAPSDQGIYIVSEYRGTAHALRRDIFNRLGGYRGSFVHQCEEGEYCMRLLDAGYVVRLGRADPIHHLESPKRDRTRIFHYQARNHILWAWYDVPWPYLPLHLLATTFNTLRDGLRKNYFRASLHGAGRGYVNLIHAFGQRQPITSAAYKLFRRLRKSGPQPLSAIENELPPLQHDQLVGVGSSV